MHDEQTIARPDSEILGALVQQPADPLLALIRAFRNDTRANKIDVVSASIATTRDGPRCCAR